MRIVFLGAPGSGKGTQASKVRAELGIAHISTGDLLRAQVKAGTPLGIQAKAVMDAGHLVSDDVVLGMLEARLAEPDTRDGFILDGYPRNLVQAGALDALLKRIDQPLDVVVLLEVPGELIVSRLAGRAQAEGRKDDTPETVRERLRVYARDTEPVVGFYRDADKLVEVDGVGDMDQVNARILAAIRATA
jgi:adenylate kinase